MEVGSEGSDGDSVFLSPSFILFEGRQWVSPVICLGQRGCMYVVSCFPRVVCIGIALPLDKILELSFTSEVTVINDGLYFVLFGVFDKVRWWPRVVGPMLRGFTIRGQEGRMKDVMDSPGCGEPQLICDR